MPAPRPVNGFLGNLPHGRRDGDKHPAHAAIRSAI